MNADDLQAMLLLTAIVGALVSALATIITRHLVDHLRGDDRPAPQQMRFGQLNVHLVVNAEHGCLDYRISASEPQLVGSFVEAWLDHHGLVASPKGADFQAARVPNGTRRAEP